VLTGSAIFWKPSASSRCSQNGTLLAKDIREIRFAVHTRDARSQTSLACVLRLWVLYELLIRRFARVLIPYLLIYCSGGPFIDCFTF
jgi:hypothetical protein